MQDAAQEAGHLGQVEDIPYVPLEEIARSKTNPRRTLKDAFFADLVQSVKDHGVLQPILVRPLDSEHHEKARNKKALEQGIRYEIVAGHRRYEAAKEAGLAEIPAMVRPLSDEQAIEIQVIENLQRTDLHPLEEAEGYRQLMHVHKYDVARIAERIGRSAKYVYDRVKLLSLTKDAQKLFVEDRIAAGHAILLARLKPEDQARALNVQDENHYGRGTPPLFQEEYSLFTEEEQDAFEEARAKDPYHGLKARSVRELQAWIDRHVRFDAGAPDVPDLFPETHVEICRAKEEAERIIPITHEYQVQPEARDGSRIWGPQSWQRADGAEDSKPCEHSVIGVIVIGPGRGEALKVCTAKEKCKIHWGEWQRARAKRQKAADREGSTGEERREAETRRYKEQQDRQDLERKQRAKAAPLILEAVAAAVAKAPAGATGRLADLLVQAVHGQGYGAKPISNAVPRGKSAEDLVRHLVYNAIAGVSQGWRWDLFAKWARAVGVDVAKMLKAQAAVQTSAKAEASAKKGKARRGVCRICGCTEENACFDKKNGATCSWVNSRKTLCSNCEGKAALAKGARPRGKKK